MKVINFWAGPGAGKSTASAGLFYKMKSAGKSVELVTEYPKELVYEGDYVALANSSKIVQEQDHRLRRLIGHVNYAITDSPLPLALLYVKPPFDTNKFRDKVMGLFNSYSNVNFFVDRVKPYYEYGRYQTESEARDLDNSVGQLLRQQGIPHWNVQGDDGAPDAIMQHLFPKEKFE